MPPGGIDGCRYAEAGACQCWKVNGARCDETRASSRLATSLRSLDGRARDRAVRTEHATVALFRLEQFATAHAFEEMDAGVRGHGLNRGVATPRAGQFAGQDNCAGHGLSVAAPPERRKKPRRDRLRRGMTSMQSGRPGRVRAGGSNASGRGQVEASPWGKLNPRSALDLPMGAIPTVAFPSCGASPCPPSPAGSSAPSTGSSVRSACWSSASCCWRSIVPSARVRLLDLPIMGSPMLALDSSRRWP
jgi:hypothetical protein